MPRRKSGSALRKDATKKPQDWDKAVSVAHLRLLGATQDQAAVNAGAGKRTICSWEASDWWPEAQAEAKQRWLQGCDGLAMEGMVRSFRDPNEYASSSKWWLDRREPALAPPVRRLEHGGPDGGPIQIDFDAARDRLAELLSRKKEA